jgi:hypothetical protein
MSISMNPDDALRFAQERLHHRTRADEAPFPENIHRRTRPRVTRRFAMRLPRGRTEVLRCVDRSVVVRCAQGSLWVTQDGACKDVILDPDQSYRAEGEQPMHVHALQPTLVEFEFEDEATPE